MKIKVKIPRKNEIKEIQLKDGSTVEDALSKLQIKPDTVIVMSNKTPVPIDDILKNEQELTIIQVFSGG